MICIAIVPVVSAADAGTSSYHVSNATPEQLEKINALWGTDITIGEYMEKVHPEHLVDISDDVKKIMDQRKMIWPDEKNEMRFAQLSRLATTLTVSCTISKVSSTRIDYSGKSQLSSGVATYIYNEAFVVNAANTKVDSTSASTQAANSVSTINKMYFWPPNGNYHVTSYGYTISPNLEDTDATGTISIP
ncbi:MAG: hypothetical protein WC342_01795 [Methanoregula sp.]